MTAQYFGTIAALQFCVPPNQGFEDIVEELDISFRPYGLNRRTLTWDTDDIAIIERDSLRLLLGWLPAENEDDPSFLVFSVGHVTDGGNLLVNRETCEFVKEILISHLSSYLSFETVFHADATQPVDTLLVDTVTEILHHDFIGKRDVAAQNVNARGWKRDRAFTRDIRLDPDFMKAHTPEFANVETPKGDYEILDPEDVVEEEETSLPKRLTIYTLGATMLIYTPPVGASLLVYSTLRDLVPSSAQTAVIN